MASIRRLKKDIDYLTFAVVNDSLNCLAYGKSADELGDVVQQIIDARNDMRRRVNAGKQLLREKEKLIISPFVRTLWLVWMVLFLN